jgi:hypothetical protein
MNTQQIVTTFLETFMSGDIGKASSLVREDFLFHAPLQTNWRQEHLFHERRPKDEIHKRLSHPASAGGWRRCFDAVRTRHPHSRRYGDDADQ